MRTRFTKALSLLLIVFCLVSTLTGCYDMLYEDNEQYYDMFEDDIYLYYLNDEGDSASDSVESLEGKFYNERTANDFDEDVIVDSAYYCYFAVQLHSKEGNPVDFGELALYVKGEESGRLGIRMFVVDELPEDIFGFNMPAFETNGDGTVKTDPVTHEPVAVTYDDVYAAEDSICNYSLNLKKGEWSSIFVEEWNAADKTGRVLTLENEQYLLIQFLNNTGYGNAEGLSHIKFKMTNFIFGLTNKK